MMKRWQFLLAPYEWKVFLSLLSTQKELFSTLKIEEILIEEIIEETIKKTTEEIKKEKTMQDPTKKTPQENTYTEKNTRKQSLHRTLFPRFRIEVFGHSGKNIPILIEELQQKLLKIQGRENREGKREKNGERNLESIPVLNFFAIQKNM